MKYTVLLFGMLLGCSTARAQGTIYFYNHVPSIGLDAPVFDTDGTSRLSGYHFQAQLYAGASANSLAPVGPIAIFGGAEAGYWMAPASSLTCILPEIGPGVAAYAQVRVWSYLRGATYEQVAAANGKHGSSEVFMVVTGGDTGGGSHPPDFPAYLTGLRSFSLTGTDPIPEPSSVALLLGAAAALVPFLRQRREARPA